MKAAEKERGAKNELGRDPLNRGIPLVLEPGIILLGAPVGSESYEDVVIKDRVEKI